MDHAQYIKSGDIGQMLVVSDVNTPWKDILPTIPQESEKKAKGNAFQRVSGLTPPTTNIVNRMWKKTSWHNKYDRAAVAATEQEIET